MADGPFERQALCWPCNTPLERRVLGSMMLFADSAQHAKHSLHPEDFYDEKNRRLFSAFLSCMPHGEIDTDLLIVECRNDPELVTHYWSIEVDTMRGERNEEACRHLRELRTLRQVATAALEIKQAFLQEPIGSDAGERLDWAASRISNALSLREAGCSARSIEHVMGDIIRRTLEPPPDVPCVPSRINGLNAMLNGGFENGTQAVIAGRPGTGKTSLGLDCAVVAAEAGHHAIIYSFEMGDIRLAERLVAARAQLDSRLVRRPGALHERQKGPIIHAAMQLASLPLQIINAVGWTIDELIRHAQREHMKRPLGLIAVDYAGLVKVRAKRSREEEVATVSSEVHNLAVKCDCPSLLLAQLNREVDKRSSQRPVLSDLRESGSLEQDADYVIFTWHDENGNSELILGKNRGGDVGAVPVKFQKQFTRFVDM